MNYDTYLCIDHNRYDLHRITKKIRTKKFICEVPIGFSKLIAYLKYISSHETERFMVIIPTVNISEEFYTKLSDVNFIKYSNMLLFLSLLTTLLLNAKVI